MPALVRPMHATDIEGMVQVFDLVASSHNGYISYSELQEGVALDPHTLSPARFAIWRQSFADLFAAYPAGQFVAADSDTGAIVGFQVVERTIGLHSRFGVLQDFCVLPTYRGDGVGRQLFEAALDQLALDGITRIFFESGIGNTSFHAWAERWGFHPVAMVFMADR